jgi:hypothetical protein
VSNELVRPDACADESGLIAVERLREERRRGSVERAIGAFVRREKAQDFGTELRVIGCCGLQESITRGRGAIQGELEERMELAVSRRGKS